MNFSRTYTDPLYGQGEILEPVLVDLLETRAVQRLQGVLQHGITALIGITHPTTRFEHSIGVMLLVRRLGGSLEEQIAALLHDVSHTAFSHVIDYVFNDHDRQGYHERMKASYIERSDLPQTLARHGYDWRDFLEDQRFPLLEQPSPALCADRLDYFLRDSLSLRLSTAAHIQQVLAGLVVREGRIGLQDLPAARWVGYTFIAADEASWANFREVGLYELAARAIRAALRQGVLSEADLWDTDARVWARLQAANEPEIREEVRRVSAGTRFVWDEHSPTFWVSTKLRSVDPDVLVGGRFARLSELDPEFAAYREAYLKSKAGRWPVKVID